jgi:isopenicillin-N epimerase
MREQFLLDPALTFLNHGSYGACPKPVFDDYQRWQREMERNPVVFLGRRSAALLAQARDTLALYLGADNEDLVFISNATTGVNAVARSFALQAGDEVLGTNLEYGACDATWRLACAAQGASYRRVAIPLPFEPERFVERMLAALTPRTRLVFVSHITSQTALIFPVAELCAALRERGIASCIDGAHAPGQVPLDLSAIGADWYTGNCHKWLCAPKGSAFLHVRSERQAALHAPVVSWGYVADETVGRGESVLDGFTGRTPLERRMQWQGTRDVAAYLAVPAAIAFAREHSMAVASARCHAWALQTQTRVLERNGLAPIGPDHSFAQMVPIPVRTADPVALRRTLFDGHGIEVPVTQHEGQAFVRVSVAAYTTQAELDRLVSVLATLNV